MPFLLAEILNFQGSTHQYGVGSFSYLSIPPEVDNNYMANLKQKPRVERLRQLGRIMTGRIYQYDENQMSLF